MTTQGGHTKWRPGQSGNPTGKKAGTRNRKTLLMEELERDGSALAAAIKAKALEGDASCMSLWLSRLEPVARTRGETVEFAFDPTATPAANIEAVLKTVAAGDMTVETGAQLISGIRQLADVRVAEMTDDKERTLIDAFKEFAKNVPT